MSEVITLERKYLDILKGFEFTLGNANTLKEPLKLAIKTISEHDNLVFRAEKAEAEVERLRNILKDCKTYIEDAEERFDGEWGSCRDIAKIILDNNMPDLYEKICEVLEAKPNE